MKGKKVDTDFLSSFIEECLLENICSPQEIVLAAKEKIRDIDAKIIEANYLKIIRSKLLDVVNTFEKEKKSALPEEVKLLTLYRLSYPNLCKDICLMVKNGPIKANKIKNISGKEVLFCVKQLIENKVLQRNGDIISADENFDLYLKKVLMYNG